MYHELTLRTLLLTPFIFTVACGTGNVLYPFHRTGHGGTGHYLRELPSNLVQTQDSDLGYLTLVPSLFSALIGVRRRLKKVRE